MEAYIVAIGELEMRERMALARTLWDSGVKVCLRAALCPAWSRCTLALV